MWKQRSLVPMPPPGAVEGTLTLPTTSLVSRRSRVWFLHTASDQKREAGTIWVNVHFFDRIHTASLFCACGNFCACPVALTRTLGAREKPKRAQPDNQYSTYVRRDD